MAKSNQPQYKQRGYPLPDVIEPPDCISVCVPVPNDVGHIRAFLGQLDMLGYWWNWERDDLKQGKDAAALWRLIVECVRQRMDLDCGCGCGDSLPKQYRYDENGKLEVSLDGGQTWQDGSAYDERNLITVYPPAETLPADSQCLYAENIKDEVKKQIETILNNLETGGTVASAAAALLPLLVTIGFPAAPLAAFLILVYGLISVIVSVIATGVENSFDTAFWDEFQCMWFCVIQEDGEVTDAMIEVVKQNVADYFTPANPLATKAINDTMGILGAKALTNAARLGDSILTSDCSGCDCGEWCYEFDFTLSDQGWEASTTVDANYSTGNGWGVGADQGVIFIKKTFSPTAAITSIRVIASGIAAAGGVGIRSPMPFQNAPTGDSDHIFTVTYSGTEITAAFDSNFAGGINPPYTGYITKVVVTGLGDNPFGTSNCP